MQFGRFLIDSGAITAAQLVSALDRQRHDQIPIGELAIAKGYLAYRDVANVLALRVDDRRSSDFFGDVSVELGILSREQVDELIADQRVTRKPLGEFLVECSALTADSLQRELREYRSACAA